MNVFSVPIIINQSSPGQLSLQKEDSPSAVISLQQKPAGMPRKKKVSI